MGRRFKSVSREDQERDYEKALNKGVDFIQSDIPQFRPRDASNCVRWIRPLEDDKAVNHPLGAEIIVHYIDGFGYFLSPRSLDRTAHDPLDDLSREVLKVDPDAKDIMNTSRRVVGHILDFGSDPDRGELKLYQAPGTLVDDMLYAAKDRRTGKTHSLEDPETGYAVFFDKTGSQRSTKYLKVELDRDPFPIEDELAEDMEYLDDVLVFKTDEELRQVAEKVLDSLRGRGGGGRSRRSSKDDSDEGGRGGRGRGRDRDGTDEQQHESPPPRSGRSRRTSRDDEGGRDRGRGGRDDSGSDDGGDVMDETRRRVEERLAQERGRGGADEGSSDDGGRRGFRGRGNSDDAGSDEGSRRGGRRRR